MPLGNFLTHVPRLPARWIALLLVMVTVVPVFTGESFVISERSLRQAEEQYGSSARKRLLAWQDLMRMQGGNDLAKLEKVNRFFNKTRFLNDSTHWDVEDYWATPTEFLASDGGDCEDFAIAKYFTLISLGIKENQLTLTYVTALRLNLAHMVLTYYPAPGVEPLVLDNLVDAIKSSSERTDLLPVYSLNGSGLWVAKQRGKGERVGDGSRLTRWQDLLTRMTEELH
ncbi:MAG: transglutaminase-like cysteine peptidase [Desulfobulbaceae bacterium]|nr:transglutaminase-like cysteine peptidase [Desulfobulbaceae bacterium]